MTDHLPECPVERCCARDERATMALCICDRLRSCGQRSYTLGIEVGKHDGWVAGHAAGVQAARDAVAALMPDTADEGVVLNALAAIDALREERK